MSQRRKKGPETAKSHSKENGGGIHYYQQGYMDVKRNECQLEQMPQSSQGDTGFLLATEEKNKQYKLSIRLANPSSVNTPVPSVSYSQRSSGDK